MAKKRKQKINWQKIAAKAFEDGIRKSIEIGILVIILGVASKTLFVVVPAVVFSSLFVKFLNSVFVS
tara:strand:+ start:1991 stop:2191 length:201 start_codon:yes stop_codon:yes gene_type:complete